MPDGSEGPSATATETLRGADPALIERRRLIENALAAQPQDPGMRVVESTISGVPTLLVTPEQGRCDALLLHFHGGGFRVGSTRGYLPFLTRLAAASGARVVGVDYALAPEQPFPFAVEQGLRVFDRLRDRGELIILTGDSAGAALAASVALEAGGARSSQHVATILLSPWVDLTVTNASYQDNAATDLTFSAESAREAVAQYVGAADASDPRVSPGLGDWAGQPPLFLESSSTEVLRDDGRALAIAAMRAGVSVWFREVPDQPHNWQIAAPPPESARMSLRSVADFVATVAPRRDGARAPAMSDPAIPTVPHEESIRR